VDVCTWICVCICAYMYEYIHICTHKFTTQFRPTPEQIYLDILTSYTDTTPGCAMRWSRLVGSTKLYVSFAKETIKETVFCKRELIDPTNRSHPITLQPDIFGCVYVDICTYM